MQKTLYALMLLVFASALQACTSAVNEAQAPRELIYFSEPMVGEALAEYAGKGVNASEAQYAEAAVEAAGIAPAPAAAPLYAVAEPAMTTIPVTSGGDEFAGSVSESELDQNRGAFLPSQISVSSLSAVIMSSSSNGITGSNSINNALNGNSGVFTVFQNTGNNVVLQSATNINVQFND